MPVEIRELVIKTTIGKSDDPTHPSHSSVLPEQIPRLKEEIIQTCLNQLKAWMKHQSER
ncbi:MAG: DUF5908 family protein [Bacteroidota bacterium]